MLLAAAAAANAVQEQHIDRTRPMSSLNGRCWDSEQMTAHYYFPCEYSHFHWCASAAG
jgi:hypothetical protein